MIKGNIPVTWLESDYKHQTEWLEKTKEEHIASIDLVEGIKLNNNDHGVFIWNTDLPQVFYNIAENFNLKKTVCVVDRMDPGQVLPFHRDKYQTYIKRNNIQRKEDIIRIIVFLHDQKPGHQLWVENEICMGDAGSYFGWHADTKHMAANLGYEPRYILQITGLKQ